MLWRLIRLFGVGKYMMFPCFRELTANHLTIYALRTCILACKFEQKMNSQNLAFNWDFRVVAAERHISCIIDLNPYGKSVNTFFYQNFNAWYGSPWFLKRNRSFPFGSVVLCCVVLRFIALFKWECQDCEHLVLILIHIHIFITRRQPSLF